MAEPVQGMVFEIEVDASTGKAQLASFRDEAERASRAISRSSEEASDSFGDLEGQLGMTGKAARGAAFELTDAGAHALAMDSAAAIAESTMADLKGTLDDTVGALSQASDEAETLEVAMGALDATGAAVGGRVAQITKAVGLMTTRMSGALPLIGGFLAAFAIAALIGSAARAIISFGVAVLRAALDSEELIDALRTLRNQTAALGDATGDRFSQLRKVGAEMALALGLEEEMVLKTMESIAARTESLEAVEALTEASLDLAAANGIDGVAAFKAIDDASQGHAKGLRALGVDISDTEAKMGGLDLVLQRTTDRLGGAAANAASTYAVALGKMGAAWDRVLKTLGTFISKSPAVVEFLNLVARLLFEVSKQFEQTRDVLKPVIQFVIEFTTTLVYLAIIIREVDRQYAGWIARIQRTTGFVGAAIVEFTGLSSTLRGLIALGDIAPEFSEESIANMKESEDVLFRILGFLAEAEKRVAGLSGELGTALGPPGGTDLNPPGGVGDEDKLGFGLDAVLEARENLDKLTEAQKKFEAGVESLTSLNADEKALLLAQGYERIREAGRGLIDDGLPQHLVELKLALGSLSVIDPPTLTPFVSEILSMDESIDDLRVSLEALNALQGAITPEAYTEALAEINSALLFYDSVADDVLTNEEERAARWQVMRANLNLQAENFKVFGQELLESSLGILTAQGNLLEGAEKFADGMVQAYQVLGSIAGVADAILGENNKLSKGLKKIQGTMLIATGIFTIFEGVAKIGQGIANYNPDQVARGVFEVAQGTKTLQAGKELAGGGGGGAASAAAGATGGSSSVGGPSGVEAQRTALRELADERRRDELAELEGREVGSGGAAVVVAGEQTSGRNVNIFAFDSESFDQWLKNDPSRAKAVIEAAEQQIQE